jgi:hypothetical protein
MTRAVSRLRRVTDDGMRVDCPTEAALLLNG